MDSDNAETPDPPTVVPRWLRWFRDVVFPHPPTPQHATRKAILGYLLGFALASTYLLVIPGGRSRIDRIWGEDGVIFLQAAWDDGFLSPIFTSYAGYLHLLPRLAAEFVSHLPIAWWAVGVAVTAAMIRAALALLVYAASYGHLSSRVLRGLVAAAVIVLPAGNNETLNNLANLHWFVLFAAFWTLLWRPTYRWQSALACVTLVILTMTTAIGMLLVPLAALRLALPRGRERAPAIAYFLGLAAAMVPILTSSRPRSPLDLVAALQASAARGPLVTFTGSELASRVYPHLTSGVPLYSWPALLGVVLVCALAGIAVLRGSASRRSLTLLCLAFGGTVIFMSLYKNWEDLLRITQDGVVLNVQRYSAAPCLFLITAVLMGLAEIPRTRWRYAMIAAQVAVAAVVATGVVYQWQSDLALLEGITWSQALDQAREQCASGEPEARITTIPESRTYVLVSCDALE